MEKKTTKGEKLRSLMKERNVTADELAVALNCHSSAIFKHYQKDNFHTETLEKICDVFGISITYFFDEKYVNSNNNNAIGSLTAAGNNNTISNNTIHGYINVALPKEGFQKIINSDGTQNTIEIQSSSDDPKAKELEKLLSDKQEVITELQARIIKLQDMLMSKMS